MSHRFDRSVFEEGDEVWAPHEAANQVRKAMVQQSCDSTGVDYVGDMNATCPITLASLHEIKWPVAFRACPHQPYEAKALITWLQHKQTNPLTNTPVEMWNLSALPNTP
jgi:hypothetical protein